MLDIKDHCNKTVEIYEEISSPELTHLNRNRPLLCTYRFRSFRGAPRDWVLRIRFKKFKVGNILNATHCDGGYLQVNTKQFCKFMRRKKLEGVTSKSVNLVHGLSAIDIKIETITILSVLILYPGKNAFEQKKGAK